MGDRQEHPSLPVLGAETQIIFAVRLDAIDALHLGPALSAAVAELNIAELDAEFAKLLSNAQLAYLARAGLRAETFFPSVLVLTSQPRLVSYYRLLYGLSQKEFYRTFGIFRRMEERGELSARAAQNLPLLCSALCRTGWMLLSNLPTVTLARIRDLQLLTLGPQLRGGRLNEIGKGATEVVFRLILGAITPAAIISSSTTRIVLRNASGRLVVVSFASDPDIAISEELSASTTNRLAIEIKGGTDLSNIHNRLGEAEKSHQKARAKGFTEFWTIKNAAVNPAVAAQESPSTNLFFELSGIVDPSTDEWRRFRDELTSRLGVSSSAP